MLIEVNINLWLFFSLNFIVYLFEHNLINEIFKCFIVHLFFCNKLNNTNVNKIELFISENFNNFVVCCKDKLWSNYGSFCLLVEIRFNWICGGCK